MTNPTALRDHLLASLRALRSPYQLGLTVLVSQPKKTSSIFPHTPNPPKCTQQEILVVLSTELPRNTTKQTDREDGIVAASGGVGSSSTGGSSTNTPTPDTDLNSPAPRVLVCAISAYLYTFPATSTSFEPTSILYISKVDSSGYSPPSSAPLPTTRTFVRSFLVFFLLTHPQLRIQLFARAQRQYLFANSADGGSKKVLGGMGLCKWWKGVYEDAATGFEMTQRHHKKNGEDVDIKLNFVLPGYEENEAKLLLGAGRPLPQGLGWVYGPPFSSPIISGSLASTSLATLIPSLPDDPKTRFLEELVSDHVPSVPHPHPTSSNSKAQSEQTRKTRKEREAEDDLRARTQAHAALGRVTAEEFWERIGFRQECASGDVTGFFTLELGGVGDAGQRRGGGLKAEDSTATVVAVAASVHGEDSCGEGAAKEVNGHGYSLSSDNGNAAKFPASSPVSPRQAASTLLTPTPSLADTITAVPTPVSSASASASAKAPLTSPEQTGTPDALFANSRTFSSSNPALLPPAILSRLLTALTNLDFASLPLAKEGTELWLKSTRSLVISEIGEQAWAECTGSIEGSGGRLLDPPTSAVEVGDGKNGTRTLPLPGEAGGEASKKRVVADEAPVTMLQPRKKKKL